MDVVSLRRNAQLAERRGRRRQAQRELDDAAAHAAACTDLVPYTAATTAAEWQLVDAAASAAASAASTATAASTASVASTDLAQRTAPAAALAPPQGDEVYGSYFLWVAGRPVHMVTLYKYNIDTMDGMTRMHTNWHGEEENSGRLGAFYMNKKHDGTFVIKLLTRYIPKDGPLADPWDHSPKGPPTVNQKHKNYYYLFSENENFKNYVKFAP
jgi:hypothetical protein